MMSEPNPYQPPQPLEPLPTDQVGKRTMARLARGWLSSPGLICLLMPPATRVAAFLGESTALLLLYAVPSDSSPSVALVAAIVNGPPAVTAIAMIGWAIHVYDRNRQVQRRGAEQLAPGTNQIGGR